MSVVRGQGEEYSGKRDPNAKCEGNAQIINNNFNDLALNILRFQRDSLLKKNYFCAFLYKDN
jgi:hypothetical protein